MTFSEDKPSDSHDIGQNRVGNGLLGNIKHVNTNENNLLNKSIYQTSETTDTNHCSDENRSTGEQRLTGAQVSMTKRHHSMPW